jgi:hypothetical protein
VFEALVVVAEAVTAVAVQCSLDVSSRPQLTAPEVQLRLALSSRPGLHVGTPTNSLRMLPTEVHQQHLTAQTGRRQLRMLVIQFQQQTGQKNVFVVTSGQQFNSSWQWVCLFMKCMN